MASRARRVDIGKSSHCSQPPVKGAGCVVETQAESADHVAVSVAERGPARATGRARHLQQRLALF